MFGYGSELSSKEKAFDLVNAVSGSMNHIAWPGGLQAILATISRLMRNPNLQTKDMTCFFMLQKLLFKAIAMCCSSQKRSGGCSRNSRCTQINRIGLFLDALILFKLPSCHLAILPSCHLAILPSSDAGGLPVRMRRA